MAADTDEPLIPATPAHTTAANVLSVDLVNGDFESGLGVGWSEYSSNGYSIITQVDVLKPHSGSWAAWLGGIDDEQSYIQQDFSINGEPAALTYWYWIESVDTCNSDTAQVMADETILLSLDLCESSATGGWVEGEADLGAFIGQTITLKIEVDTDESYRSSMFIDDVSMGDDLESLFLPLVVR
ncbi:MAG: hypothetical protein A2136_00290 [Chloroflexi bacterium RBG_16_54_11]|nr:MAG: hypothetical protein A2136_00290 [Chloroflexi bacterium RBG_16_54_11]